MDKSVGVVAVEMQIMPVDPLLLKVEQLVKEMDFGLYLVNSGQSLIVGVIALLIDHFDLRQLL